jgi:hypothetical protein
MQKVEANAGLRVYTLKTVPYRGRVVPLGAKVPLYQRVTCNPPRQDVSFTGKGVVPDYMTEYALTMMPEASRTSLEDGIPYGSEGMMPPPGFLLRAQAGQKTDTGSGGAGSFATANAFKAKG